jgi:3-oxoacyl-[acyl-carrier-protein] synthase III
VGSIIAGTGIAVPDRVVTNDDLARIMDTSDEWIASRTGVRERRFVEPGVGASGLAAQAVAAALADAGLEPGEVDVLVTATMTPDFQAPGIAALVQRDAGLGQIPAFDLRQQCSGFLYGMDLADGMIAAGRAETVVVVGAEVHAGYLPWGDTWDIVLGLSDRTPTEEEWERNTRYRAWSVLFGDGAGAMVIRRGADPSAGFLASRLHTDGTQFELILVPGLGFARRPYADRDQIDGDLHLPVMDGGGLYRQAVRLMPESVHEVAAAAGVDLAEVDVVVAHQANDRILAGVRKAMGVDEATVPSNIARYGNTTSGTLPILYHELRSGGRLPPGSLVCFTAFGAGAHWGAALYREP